MEFGYEKFIDDHSSYNDIIDYGLTLWVMTILFLKNNLRLLFFDKRLYIM